MIDFAKYAFNKSHAAAYAVVAYQTAWLKYYYPVEFMAALMTSVIDNSSKVSEYILTCRQMGISILAPDINESEGVFSVSEDGIRYGLSAIKSVGRPVIEGVLKERKNGPFCDLSAFIERMSGKDINKRTIENLIKAGAFDSFPANRRQMIMVYAQIMDQIAQKRKTELEGQMSLFDFVSEEEKDAYKIQMPDVKEYGKEDLLAFEKEVLGFYISGHPLEEYEAQWKRGITHVTSDFLPVEEGEEVKLRDGEHVVIGGILAAKTTKTTKSNQMMAFITIEDLVGSVEVLVFPRDYEKNNRLLKVDDKVFVSGRVSGEEDKASKLILERIVPFETIHKELWIQFADLREYQESESELYRILMNSEGKDSVHIYLRKEKMKKTLPSSRNIRVSSELLESLYQKFGEKNVKEVHKHIENANKML